MSGTIAGRQVIFYDDLSKQAVAYRHSARGNAAGSFVGFKKEHGGCEWLGHSGGKVDLEPRMP